MVKAFGARSPSSGLLHFLDEGLLPLANRDGLTAHAIGELERLVKRAVDSGVDGILLTCSAYSPAVPAIQQRCPVPILSADDAMLRTALTLGSRIGVVATVEAAGPTTADLLCALAKPTGQSVHVEVRVVPPAFSALKSGDGARHDELVRQAIADLLPHCDVIVLAQISMARALAGIGAYAKPVLSSPASSAAAILARLNRATPAAQP
jgi:Asp/Glu/hydantoin racemase